ncbi:MAG TPA: CBS domain-containing protein [Labilithrix sp.]|nr:CBS domain-containing protein [Labilithrix sp.]
MTRDVIVVPPELTLANAWRVMTRDRIRHLPVSRAGALIGMLSDRDVLARGTMGADGQLHVPPHIVVGEAMTPTPVVTCEASTEVSTLVHLMTEKKIDAIPVVKGLRLVGLVTTTDLLLLLLDRDEAEVLPFEFRLLEDPRAYA